MASAQQDFASLLIGLVNKDSAVRNQYEKTYQEAKTNQPDAVSEALALALSSPEPALQQLAAVLLRRCLEDETELGAWHKLSDDRRKKLRHEVVLAANKANGRLTRKAITHVVAQLARLSLHNSDANDAQQEWPELFQLMFQTSQSPEPDKRESGFEMFSAVAEYAPKAVAPHSMVIGEVLGKGLKDTDSVDVRLASLKALASLLVSLDISSLAPFRPAVPLMLETLRSSLDQAAATKDDRLENVARDAIKALIEIVGHHPKFLRPDFLALAHSMIAIVTAAPLDSSTRSLGLEFLIAACESMPTFLRKEHGELVSEFIPLCMRVLCEQAEAEPDMEVWELNLDGEGEDDDDDDALCSAAEAGIHRLATALGGKTCMAKVFALIPTLLQDQDWRKRRTALQTLSLMGEGCGKKMYAKLPEIVRWAVGKKNDPHPKVRYACLHMLGRMCLDFGSEEKCGESKPTFQKKLASQTLPVLAEALRDPSARVATHSASSLVNFFSETADLSPTDVAPYLDAILEGLMAQVMNASLTTKDEALTAISCIATVAGSNLFGRYYDHLMPLALSVASETSLPPNEKVSSLRGRALECAGLMAAAVGRERFAQHAGTTLPLVIGCCRQKDDSTLRRYAIAASVRVASAIKEEFLPFLEELVPEIIQGCKEDFGLALIDSAEAEQSEAMGFQVMQFQVRGEGLKTIHVNSVAVQEISACAFALYNFANSFKEAFAPFAPQAFAAMLPLVDYDALESIRNIAVVTLPYLVRCVASQPAIASDLFTVAFFGILNKIKSEEDEPIEATDELEIESSMETTLHLAESLVIILKNCYESGGAKDNDPYLGGRIQQFQPKYGFNSTDHFQQGIMACAEALQRRIEIIVENREQFRVDIAEHDEASEEKFLQLDAKHFEVAERLVDCNGYLLKICAVNAAVTAPLVRQFFLPVVQNLSLDEAPDDIKKLGICLLDDFVEFMPVLQEDSKVRERCIELCLEASPSEDDALSRAAVWGLGVAAVYCGPDFDPYIVQIVQTLVETVETKRGQMSSQGVEEDKQFTLGLVVDNALSSLEKIFRHRSDALTKAGVPAEAILQKVMQFLPCTTDAEEAKVVNVQIGRYVGSPLLSQEAYCKMLISQLSKGYEEIHADWEDEDAFLDERTRVELVQGLARGTFQTPTGLSQTEMRMLAELGSWFAKREKAVAAANIPSRT